MSVQQPINILFIADLSKVNTMLVPANVLNVIAERLPEPGSVIAVQLLVQPIVGATAILARSAALEAAGEQAVAVGEGIQFYGAIMLDSDGAIANLTVIDQRTGTSNTVQLVAAELI